eukprot:CAMPEP_0176096428 /NCGR_PEP_ID=MMETSP0120_2-20121206/48340_1 /TAXON_ID=160619 /ORGANISM="Kryptoperidinium foliaceum, Strain CCMP 1326" /LENGTH=87 /DNA_ID=CAMNT_0017430413 /DNA_START=103 /DNA_END=363 /DNA_ORIENTATION=+
MGASAKKERPGDAAAKPAPRIAASVAARTTGERNSQQRVGLHHKRLSGRGAAIGKRRRLPSAPGLHGVLHLAIAMVFCDVIPLRLRN